MLSFYLGSSWWPVDCVSGFFSVFIHVCSSDLCSCFLSLCLSFNGSWFLFLFFFTAVWNFSFHSCHCYHLVWLKKQFLFKISSNVRTTPQKKAFDVLLLYFFRVACLLLQYLAPCLLCVSLSGCLHLSFYCTLNVSIKLVIHCGMSNAKRSDHCMVIRKCRNHRWLVFYHLIPP